MLSLKVEIGATGKVSAMLFNGDMSVAEAMKQIEAKFGNPGENYTDYGLLRTATVGEAARWLKEDKTLVNQNLNNLVKNFPLSSLFPSCHYNKFFNKIFIN